MKATSRRSSFMPCISHWTLLMFLVFLLSAHSHHPTPSPNREGSHQTPHRGTTHGHPKNGTVRKYTHTVRLLQLLPICVWAFSESRRGCTHLSIAKHQLPFLPTASIKPSHLLQLCFSGHLPSWLPRLPTLLLDIMNSTWTLLTCQNTISIMASPELLFFFKYNYYYECNVSKQHSWLSESNSIAVITL